MHAVFSVCKFANISSDGCALFSNNNIHIRKSVCTHFYIYVHVCMCLCVCVYICVYVCMYACMYVCMYVCMCVCVYLCMCVCNVLRCKCNNACVHAPAICDAPYRTAAQSSSPTFLPARATPMKFCCASKHGWKRRKRAQWGFRPDKWLQDRHGDRKASKLMDRKKALGLILSCNKVGGVFQVLGPALLRDSWLGMYVCVCLRMYVCMHACMYVCMCVCKSTMYVCMYAYIYI